MSGDVPRRRANAVEDGGPAARRANALRAGTCALLCAFGLGLPAHADTPPASALLASDHWAVRAVERLHDLGLVEAYLPAQNAVPSAQLHAALQQAAQSARSTPELAALVDGYLRRWDGEFRGGGSSSEQGWQLRRASASAEGQSTSAQDRPAPVEAPRPGFIAAPATASAGRASVLLEGGYAPHLAFFAQPDLGSAASLPRWELVTALGPWALSVGRAPIGYGLEGRRGLVMSGTQNIERFELSTQRPVHLPGPLRHVGWIAVQGFLSRLTEARHEGSPFFWGANIRVQPHPRLTLSLQRSVMVGGGVRQEPTTAGQLFKMLFATRNQLENNVAGLSGRWRLPTERVLPLTAYAEWGADDLGGQFKAPGMLLGLRSPALPGLPAVALGAEFGFLGTVCCRTHQWYTHFIHEGGWVTQDQALGHPLAGDGREYRLYGTADLFDARLRLEADAFMRQRFETNLFGAYRLGRSLGASSLLSWRLHAHAELGARLALEGGRGWQERNVSAMGTVFF